jgi:hypothetical protein
VNARKIRQAEARTARDARRRAEQPVAGSRRAERAEVWAAVAERREAARTAAREERRDSAWRQVVCAPRPGGRGKPGTWSGIRP